MTVTLPDDLPALSYDVSPDSATVGAVLPSVASSLGVGHAGAVTLPPARRAVVVLVDGLGSAQLSRRSGHAPYLRSLGSPVRSVRCGFPSTTATSMASFGTGLVPGRHGLVGWQVLMPEHDRLVNHLSWDDGPDPLTWQPHETVLQRVAAAGVAVTRVAPLSFSGSGLTRAALRGGRLDAAAGLDDAVETTLAAVRRGPRSLVFLYWGAVDKVGHTRGPDSWEWLTELERVDDAMERLAGRLPAQTSLTVTADHGMLACPLDQRLDLAERADLAAGVRHLGGEARGPQAYCEPGAAADVLQAWSELLGERACVLSRDQAVDLGLFGPVDAAVRPRIGDVVALMRADATLLDSRTTRAEVLSLVAHHGSLTLEETAIPFLHLPAA